jgi:DNA-binding SARP family transcriptional activator
MRGPGLDVGQRGVAEKIEYRILGPLEVSADGRVVEIGGRRLRALLAILLLRANEPVSRDALVHELWGERPPPGAQHSLEVYISRLRKVLGTVAGEPAVVTRPGAYCLRLADRQLDVRRFEQLVREGRSSLAAGAPGLASVTLGAALRLWRGQPLADLSGEPFAQVEIGRLKELRLGATEDRIEADLALGRHADVVSELEAMIAAHPLRERLHGQLMVALYRSERQAEALKAYQAARRTLVDELGLEPGPELQRLERAILRQDPSLELPGQAMAAPGQAAAGPRTRRRRVTAIAAAVLVVLAAALLTGSGAAHPAQPMLAGANGLVAIDPATGQLVAATALSDAPEGVSGGTRSVWAADPGGEAVTRIDPGSGTAIDRIPVRGGPGSIVSGGGAIWTTGTDAATVTRIDPVTEGVTQTITLPSVSLGAIAYGAPGPARNPRPRDRLALRSRHRAVPDRRGRRRPDPLRT